MPQSLRDGAYALGATQSEAIRQVVFRAALPGIVPDPGLHALAHVFKVEIDPYIGRLAVFRVHQGRITLRNADGGGALAVLSLPTVTL